MAGLIPQSFIDEVLDRTDIVDIISSRVQLKKAGNADALDFSRVGTIVREILN